MVRGLVIVGLAYLAFTYFVPIREQPHWLTEARLLPMVQTTADVLLSAGSRPAHGLRLSAAASDTPSAVQVSSALPIRLTVSSHDPMAELIRTNDEANRVPKRTTRTGAAEERSQGRRNPMAPTTARR